MRLPFIYGCAIPSQKEEELKEIERASLKVFRKGGEEKLGARL
jgi:hypothetical protein